MSQKQYKEFDRVTSANSIKYVRPTTCSKRTSHDYGKYCPLQMVNRFQIDKATKVRFNDYVNGECSVQDLVHSMNVPRIANKQIRDDLKQQDYQQTQGQIIKRFDILRQCIDKNRQAKQVIYPIQQESARFETNIKNSRLFSHFNVEVDKIKNKIRVKDLLTSRTDGNVEEVIKKTSHGVKIKSVALNKNVKNKPYTRQMASIKVNDFARKYFEELNTRQFVKDNQQKRKAKLKILKQRRQDLKEYIEFDSHHRTTSEPQLKDIKLYNYIHCQIENTQQDTQVSQFQVKHQKSKTSHIITNFNKVNESRQLEEDQSFESQKEMMLSQLYMESIKLQRKFMNETKLIRKLQQTKQITSLTDRISIQNQNKLN